MKIPVGTYKIDFTAGNLDEQFKRAAEQQWQARKTGALERHKKGGAARSATCHARGREARTNLPFFTVDTEGANEPAFECNGRTILRQKTILLNAGNSDEMYRLPVDTPTGLGKDARGLGTVEMLLMLLHAKSCAPKGTPFVGFGFDYDVRCILRDIPYELAWELQLKRPFKEANAGTEDDDIDADDYGDGDYDDEPEEENIYRPVLWVADRSGNPLTDADGKPIGFALYYLKRKWFKVGLLRDPENPWAPEGGIDYAPPGLMEIHDVVSYFQMSFVNTIEGMSSSINMKPEDWEIIQKFKPLRGDFANLQMDEITHYNEAECRVLSEIMRVLREKLRELGLNPLKWYGPGVLALETFKLYGIIKNKKCKTVGVYGDFLKTKGIKGSPQDWAHHTFSGGCIDTLMQGVHMDESRPICQYDISSAYPAEMYELPDMTAGVWKWHEKQKLSIDQIEALLKPMNMVSMVEINFLFNIDAPFYPLWFRCNGDEKYSNHPYGTILRPRKGWGRYEVEEVLAAIAWCRKHFPNSAPARFEFCGAWEFTPKDPNARPFAFIKTLFDMRVGIVAETERAIERWKEGECDGPIPYNVLEKVIKLILNSLYGKTAQSIGSKGIIPAATNPFFASAITAGCRAKLMRAATLNPAAVIFLATDGIQAIGPLPGLETAATKVLGKWEHAEQLDVRKDEIAVYHSPGVYQFYNAKRKRKLKTRGIPIDFAQDALMPDIVKGWKTGGHKIVVNGKTLKPVMVGRGKDRRVVTERDTHYGVNNQKPVYKMNPDKETILSVNKITVPVSAFLSLGASVASRELWEIGPHWIKTTREVNLNNPGTKRMNCYSKDRAKMLVSLEPEINLEEGISAPYYPEWLEGDNEDFPECEATGEDKFGTVDED
jgi:hypothetical protein